MVFAVVTVVGVILSMGPEGPTPLYSLLYRGLFGMAAIRAVPRFSVLALLGIAVLAALAIRSLEARQPRLARGLVVAALLAIAVEYSNGAIAYPPPPSLRTSVGGWLRDQPGSGAVLCVPMRVWLGNTPCMLQSLEHRRPVVNGYSGIMPPFFEAMVQTANRLPAADALLAMHNIGVEYVVSNEALAVEPAFSEVLVERARFDEQRVYQLHWSPEIEAKVRATVDVPPPDPGPIPFTAGEAATYRLRWTSGPLDVAAGQATISVVPPHAGAGYAVPCGRIDGPVDVPLLRGHRQARIGHECQPAAAGVPRSDRRGHARHRAPADVRPRASRGADCERRDVDRASCRDWGARPDQRVLLPAHAAAHGRRSVRHSNQRQRAPAAPRCHRGAARAHRAGRAHMAGVEGAADGE